MIHIVPWRWQLVDSDAIVAGTSAFYVFDEAAICKIAGNCKTIELILSSSSINCARSDQRLIHTMSEAATRAFPFEPMDARVATSTIGAAHAKPTLFTIRHCIGMTV